MRDNTTFSPFTEKGDQYARINTKFLSTKGIKEEESYLEEKKYSAVSFKTDPPKSFKREPDTEDDNTLILHWKKGDQHSTSSVVHSKDGPAKCQLKLDYEELKMNQRKILMKLASYATPARKKGNLKGGVIKQSVLFSCFGKSLCCVPCYVNSLCICCTLYMNFINSVVSVAN